ncbi:histone H3-like centromeric protein A isoform X1 [Boleophthalmus pectinirostris]|uniref:histone H3-like centromeric protein A isoform X1 n=1 Tax=Boleophthalmus pectinirostris TaxID=150288 RepID=UPI002432B3C7|nr:histone H3-like centromeric protein A isoform X1 [Boleophthalmus pectinirostris]
MPWWTLLIGRRPTRSCRVQVTAGSSSLTPDPPSREVMKHNTLSSRRKGTNPKRRGPIPPPPSSPRPPRRSGPPSNRSGPSRAPPGGSPRKTRYCPGVKALNEIGKYQKSTNLLLRKGPFARLVREICQSFTQVSYQWEVNGLLALQEAAVLGDAVFRR